MWPTTMGESFSAINRLEFGCIIGESDRLFKWPTKIGWNLGAILVN
jgi:hypothetical protein